MVDAPARRPRDRRRLLRGLVLGTAAIAAALLAANVVAEVAILYSGSTSVAGARSPLRFIDGGDYATAAAEGFLSITFPTAQQVAFSAAVKGADGAFGTYLLDMLEVEALTNTSTGWHAHLNVVTALSGAGINAAWVFVCTAAPTGVPDSGTAVSSGTDAAGDSWAIFAPTCAGTQTGASLLTAGTGTSLALPKLVYGTSILYLSFAIAVSSTGASTISPAALVLSTSSA